MKEKIRIAIIGIISGFFNGFVGGFGALISIMGLKKYFYLSQSEAQATSMGYMFIVSLLTSTILFSKIKLNFNIAQISYIIIANFLGAFLGYSIFRKMPNATLNIIFGVVITIAGGLMIWL